jgi:hypothetical protein
MAQEEQKIIDKKNEIENLIRFFLKENEISHLDAIINLIQNQNVIMEFILKNKLTNSFFGYMRNLSEQKKDNFTLLAEISLFISDKISEMEKK